MCGHIFFAKKIFYCILTSNAAGTELDKGSSSSGDPPMKKRRRLDIHDFPAGRQQCMSMRNTPGEEKECDLFDPNKIHIINK